MAHLDSLESIMGYKPYITHKHCFLPFLIQQRLTLMLRRALPENADGFARLFL